jgi:acetyl esterase/lipase
MKAQDLLALPRPPADRRIPYGEHPQQFGDLRVPPGNGPHPVVLLVHGGCWLAEYDLEHLSSLAAAFTAAGYATWSVEYRRLGDDGGGWPGTFEDAARAADALRALAADHPVDLSRVVAVGHSAGGHLALWLAGRHRLPSSSPLRGGAPLALRGVVSLAGIADLGAAASRRVCGDAPARLLGDSTGEAPARIVLGSPSALVPLGVPQRLVSGREDRIVPLDIVEAYARTAATAGDDVTVTVLEGCGHFELVDPASGAWPAVLGAVRGLVGPAASAP